MRAVRREGKGGTVPAIFGVMRFVMATLHFGGLAFALRLLAEGH